MIHFWKRVRGRLLMYYYAFFRALVSIHKRDNNLIVYGGALDLFIDNAKHLFILNNQILSSYRHVWLTRSEMVLRRVRNMGFEAEFSNSKQGRALMLHAGMVIYDNKINEFANHNLLSGAIRFEMWHAVQGVKYIGSIHSDPPSPYIIKSSFFDKYLHDHTYGDYVLTTSSNLKNVMSAAFMVPLERIIIADQPRSRTLFMSNKELDEFVLHYEDSEGIRMYQTLKHENRRKVIYMPTFRDADSQYIYRAIPNWETFNTFLIDNHIIFYLKVHRVTPLPQNLHYSNIKVLDNGLDIYPLLPHFDCLVTDYSSIMFEFALLKKPVIIYDYDLEEYATESRHVFKSFIDLLKSLTEAKEYKELLTFLQKPTSEIKPIPLDKYYDYPGDISNIISFINERLEQKC